MKPIKQIEYAPIKVSFRKKVQLRELTEYKRKEFIEFVWMMIFSFSVAILIIVLFFYAIL